ncbi:hypothetical protein [Streptomyces sp. RKAG293]|uniref:hypothetical protein n=1 Tax=Streptomyces sp. RKAG293 TaxID=2893403 RepID=UPI0020337005|nr:hypothetical protein [Streptomyces sp. RKAG293]MCM2419006.1 hypothetical protein [Streptomyces sp. RKAG293]
MAAIRTPQDSAHTAAEAVRAYNHATFPGNLLYPVQAYHSVASFKVMAQRLPQSFDQTSRALNRLHADGTLTADYGRVADHVGEAVAALAEASRYAGMLANALDQAHNALSPIGFCDDIDN